MKSIKEQYLMKNPKERLYGLEIPIIALTGGIGSGKSEVIQYLKSRFFCLQADRIVKEIYQRPESLAFVAKHFPQFVEGENIHFSLLRQHIFNHQQDKERLEKFIHPQIPSHVHDQIEKNAPPFLFYEIPLLFELSKEKEVDLIWTVWVPEEIQMKRLKERDQESSEETLAKVIKDQVSMDVKKDKAHFVLDNSGDRNFLFEQIEHGISLFMEN